MNKDFSKTGYCCCFKLEAKRSRATNKNPICKPQVHERVGGHVGDERQKCLVKTGKTMEGREEVSDQRGQILKTERDVLKSC